MASSPIRDISEYPRPWFYRPEVYYGFFIFPPVWSILTLRSPWHNAEGFRGIMVGGLAWFIMIAAVVLSVRWVQEGGAVNLFIFVPGILLTLVTQVQWQAHRARHGPPPTVQGEVLEGGARTVGTGDEAPEKQDSEPPAREYEEESDEEQGEGYALRRRRRRRRRSISRSSDSAPLC